MSTSLWMAEMDEVLHLPRPVHARLPVALVLTLFCSLTGVGALASEGNGVPARLPDSPPLEDAVGVRDAATRVIRHVYAVYLGIRTCSEVASELGRAEYDPGIPIEEARRVMGAMDPAARKAGIDVNSVWSEAAPSGVVTAESLRGDDRGNAPTCRKLGSVFRTDEANIQALLARLGVQADLIVKDY